MAIIKVIKKSRPDAGVWDIDITGYDPRLYWTVKEFEELQQAKKPKITKKETPKVTTSREAGRMAVKREEIEIPKSKEFKYSDDTESDIEKE